MLHGLAALVKTSTLAADTPDHRTVGIRYMNKSVCGKRGKNIIIQEHKVSHARTNNAPYITLPIEAA
jgi:hypothetical protein